MRTARLPVFLTLAASLCACLAGRGDYHGDQAPFQAPRAPRPADIALPPGYEIDAAAQGLTFPTAVVFDDEGRVYVVESGYAYGDVWAVPRLLRLEPDGRMTVVAKGDPRSGPWTGAAYSKGSFFVAEGGVLQGGRLLRIDQWGHLHAIVEDLPTQGDYQMYGPVVGPDGYVYFSVGTMTNSGVVGDDDRQLGWVDRFPDKHDVPCRDVTLSGAAFDSGGERTGAFCAVGAASTAGEVVHGASACNGAVYRVPPEGGRAQLVAWGFRAPVGLSFSPDGRLYVVDQGYDERGARPVWAAPDLLWSVSSGTWYGWPDFSGDLPLSERRFRVADGPTLSPLLRPEPGRPPRPAARLGAHSGSSGLDFSRSEQFGHLGDAFIAQFGDLSPRSGRLRAPVGFKVVRMNFDENYVEDFAVNRGPVNGPASWLGTGGLERPIEVRFNPSGTVLYIVDFGVLTLGPRGPRPRPGTGVLWRVIRRG